MSLELRSTNDRPIVFLGGIFTPHQLGFIHAESRGVVQNAADALQKNLIQGLSSTYQGPLTVLNLPFIGSYPRWFRRLIFPSTNEIVFSTVPLMGQSFIALSGVNLLSRLFSTVQGLFRITPSRRPMIIIYSAHLPFIAAAMLYRCVFRKSRICLVLPDFPEFMGEGGLAYRTYKSIESFLFYRLARHVDAFVLLTRFMAERLNLRTGQFTVVEGIANVPPETAHDHADQWMRRRRFLYTGTLAARYGVMDLVNAFRRVRNDCAELWICGDGDSKEKILEAATLDPRIRFLGQVTRAEARKLQQQATVLVNPRLPTGDFTRYSFPSKTMEYMASGRPVLMHHLSGMPDEYLPYFFRPASADVAGLTDAMERLANAEADELQAMGTAAREFVLERKDCVAQCQKIVALITSLP